jgi:hypothetical protein
VHHAIESTIQHQYLFARTGGKRTSEPNFPSPAR